MARLLVARSSLGSAVLALLALTLTAGPARSTDVIVAGDSWAAFGFNQLKSKFPSSVSLVNGAIPGMTAQLAADSGYVTSLIAVNPDVDHIYLSLGGNDVLGAWNAGNGANSAAIVDTQLRRVLDQVAAQFPQVKILLPGYDFLNFEKDTTCQLEGFLIFGSHLAAVINPITLASIRDVQANVAASYPNVTAVDAFGTLQKAANVPFAPNPLFPSPAQYMGGDGDCIHTNDQGASLFMGEIYKRYFRPIYGPGGCGAPAGGAGEVDRAALFVVPVLLAYARRRRGRGEA